MNRVGLGALGRCVVGSGLVENGIRRIGRGLWVVL